MTITLNGNEYEILSDPKLINVDESTGAIGFMRQVKRDGQVYNCYYNYLDGEWYDIEIRKEIFSKLSTL